MLDYNEVLAHALEHGLNVTMVQFHPQTNRVFLTATHSGPIELPTPIALAISFPSFAMAAAEFMKGLCPQDADLQRVTPANVDGTPAASGGPKLVS